MVDTNLNFRCHLEVTEHKLSRVVGIFCKLKHVLPQKPLLKLYYSLIHSHLLYGLVAWGSTFPSYLTKLNSLQNKTIKLIGGGTYLDDATPYYLKYNILKLNNLYKLEIGKFVHSFIHNSVHQSFTKFFIRSSDVAIRTTKSSVNLNNLYIPRYRTNRMQRSIKYQGVKIWN